MRNCLLSTLLLLIPAALLASPTPPLAGQIIDAETNRPIRDANIRVLETDRAVSSDKHGFFSLSTLPDGAYRVVVTHIAYDHSDTLTVTVPGAENLRIELTPSPWVLNDVVTTGTRSPHLLKNVPVETEVITQRDFQRTGAKSVDEALASSVGMNVTQAGLSGSEATVRGIEGDRVLILVDGERAVGRVKGAIDLSQYALTNVEKIEVVKGTGSTLYGSEAIGGVINIITRKPNSHELTGDLYFDYGSHISLNPSADFSFGRGRTTFNFGGRYYNTDGFDLDKSTPHTNGQDAVKRLNLHAKAKTVLGDRWSMTSSARYMREKRDWIESEVVQLNEIRDTTYTYNDEETNNRYEGSLSFDYLSGDRYSMKFRLFGTYYDHDFNKYGDGYWIDTSETEDLYYDLTYTSNYVIGAGHVATYGLEYIYQDLNSDELIDEKKADRSYAGYLQYEHTPFKGLSFLPGLRYEHHSSFGDHLNPSFNAMWTVNDRLKLRGMVGRGFRAPSIKQQYFVFDHTAAGYIVYGGSVLGNDLEPETSINSSVSAEFSYGTIGLHRITYFYNHLEDLIEFVLLDFNDGYWRGRYVYDNVERAITQGVEWESRVRLSSAVDFQFSYNYLYSRDLGTGSKLVNRPDHTVKVFLTGFYEKLGVGASFWGDYASRKLWVARSNKIGRAHV